MAMSNRKIKGLAFGVSNRYRFYQSGVKYGGEQMPKNTHPAVREACNPELADKKHSYDEHTLLGLCRHCALNKQGHNDKQKRLK